jgi:hypothetical protein
MSQVTPEQKETATKLLAVVGFLAAIVLLVFIAVKVVTFIPGAFSSLASIADSVYNYERTPSIVIATPNTVVKSGESFTIGMNEQKRPGLYSFSYSCATGVMVETRTIDGDITTIACGEGFTLEKGQIALDILVTTDTQRFTDLDYTIIFTPSDPRRDALTADGRVTLVNASLPTSTNLEPTPDVAIIEETPIDTDEDTITPAPAPTTPTRPVVPTPPAPTYIETPIYAIPVSNPNGTIDLRVTVVGVGTLEGTNFMLAKELEANEGGAIRFSVKNIGTKTAEDWSFKANLPADITYTSGDQKALKPNEEAIITLSFTSAGKSGTESVDVTATAKGDVNTKNNSFTSVVKIVN